jgi:hypothetical protein
MMKRFSCRLGFVESRRDGSVIVGSHDCYNKMAFIPGEGARRFCECFDPKEGRSKRDVCDSHTGHSSTTPLFLNKSSSTD